MLGEPGVICDAALERAGVASRPGPDVAGLVNRGVLLRNQAALADSANATIIITGSPRSGTSLAASALRLASLYMGTAIDASVHEDTQLAAAIENGTPAQLLGLIAQRNAAHSRWGFKRPNLYRSMETSGLAQFRAPRLIVSFRDPVAIAERIRISEMMDLERALRIAMDNSVASLRFALDATVPTLMFSYDKVMLDLPAFLQQLFAFAGLDEEGRDCPALARQLLEGQGRYLEAARVRFTGRVDSIRNGELRGWCWRLGSAVPVNVELFIDGSKAAAAVASDYRKDLEAAKIGDGRHAFTFRLGNLAWRDNSIIEVRVVGRDYAVPGSGQRVQDLSARPIRPESSAAG